jgi:hypothetical protein
MANVNFNTPQQLGAVLGRWGYAIIDEECDCALSELTDVNIENVQNGDILIYNSLTMKWENGPIPIPSISLDDLTDVTITTPLDCQLLQYDATAMQWKNETVNIQERDVSGQPEFIRGISTIRFAFNMVLNNTQTFTVVGSDIYNGMYSGFAKGRLDFVAGLAWNPYDASIYIDATDDCIGLSLSSLQEPRLKAGKISNGSVGVNFRIKSGANIIYFQNRAIDTTGVLDYYLPLAWEINESGASWQSGQNSVGSGLVNPVAGLYGLEVCIYCSPRVGSTEVDLNDITDLFEIEPFWVITKTYRQPCCT